MVTIEWSTSRFALRLLAEEGPVRLVDLAAGPSFDGPFDPTAYAHAHQPLVEIMSPLYGNDTSSNSNRHSGTHLGAALRYVRHEESSADGVHRLLVEQVDPETGLTAQSLLEVHDGVSAARSTTTVSGPRRARPAGPLGGQQPRDRRPRLGRPGRPRRLARRQRLVGRAPLVGAAPALAGARPHAAPGPRRDDPRVRQRRVHQQLVRGGPRPGRRPAGPPHRAHPGVAAGAQRRVVVGGGGAARSRRWSRPLARRCGRGRGAAQPRRPGGRGVRRRLRPDRHAAPLVRRRRRRPHLHLGPGDLHRRGRLRRRLRPARGAPAGRTPPAPAERGAAGDLQRLHGHPRGGPDGGQAAAVDRRRGRGRQRVLLHRRRLVRRHCGLVVLGGGLGALDGALPERVRVRPRPRPGAGHDARPLARARGGRRDEPGGDDAARRRLPPAQRRARPRARPLPARPAERARPGPPRRGRRPARLRARRRLLQAGLQRHAGTGDGPRRRERGRGAARAQPCPAHLAGVRPRPAPDAGAGELRFRCPAVGLRHAVPAPAAVDLRPAGTRCSTRRSPSVRWSTSCPSRPRTGPTRSRR